MVVTDPASLSPRPPATLFVLVGGDVAIATDDAAEVVRVAGGGAGRGRFAATPFYAQIARCYEPA